MLNTLTKPHEYPGKLFVVEGVDGSGKTTQIGLLAKWLSAAGHRVFLTEWNSSALVKAATRAGKKKNALTPMTFSLLPVPSRLSQRSTWDKRTNLNWQSMALHRQQPRI